MQRDWPADKDSDIETQRDAFLSAINDWLAADIVKIWGIYRRGAGWEKWMQTDWDYYLTQSFNGIEIEREQMIWGDRRQVDFVIKVNGLKYIMELKCYIQDKSLQDWRAHLDEDIGKLVGNVQSPFNTYVKFGIGICFNVGFGDPGGNYHSKSMTAQGAGGQAINYKVHYRTFAV
ncbi:hypothetical protein BDN72DRAFT_684704 [Pluteus cervinus]|uniref:Uncharacterized protein n=1 Tax=Pluteus cervinus TaxID=181527 RepID=A0ACD3ATP2_9AGAR|nr:hypothetical protein BDN72DRAFT_684704 [Pluteus cervinus]